MLFAAITPTAVTAARITAAVAGALTSQGAPSAAVAVVRDGTTIYVRAFGLRDVARSTPADARTRYEIGSITKQFTAAAILQLKEAGKLALDDPLAEYVPSFPHARRITLRQLLDQTSGLPNYTDAKDFVRRAGEPGSLAEIEAMIAGPLHFTPGTKWEYSNSNYIALGRVIEVVSGMRYRDYMQTHIFTPLGMTHTTWIADEPHLRDFAIPYWHGRENHAPLAPSPPFGERWAGAAGAIVSTAGDMALWDEALAAGRVVSPSDLKLMQTPGTLANGTPTDYGFGWLIDTFDGEPRIWHNGGTFGSSSSNMLFPRQHLDVIVLENQGFVAASAIAGDVFEALYPKIAAGAHAVGAHENPAITARAKRLIADAIAGKIPASEMAPATARALTPKMLARVSQQLASLGPVRDVIFRKSSPYGNDEIYVYRVDFAQASLQFVMTIQRATNLLDGIWFKPE